jgi:tRNA-Thr(GGU) m(6)t(6)A37 methyltransferase TsaA
MDAIKFYPIGYISSPYTARGQAPKQGIYDAETRGVMHINEKYINGVADMKEGLQYVVVFYFHKSPGYELTVRSHRTGLLTGVFSTRSPNRPNGIGLSVVKVEKINGAEIEFTGVDMLDGTPVLDIKPYISGESAK